MVVSLFLAKAFGLYLLVVVLAMLLRPVQFKVAMEAMLSNAGVLMLAALMTLILGIVLILFHSVWMLDWRLLITILCWWVFIKGCLGILFPRALISMGRFFLDRSNCSLRVMTLTDLVLASILLYLGFF